MRITVTPKPGSTLQPVTYVRKPSQCASANPADEAACTGAAAGARITTIFNQQPGTVGLRDLWRDYAGSGACAPAGVGVHRL